jgi:hypothetical protein
MILALTVILACYLSFYSFIATYANSWKVLALDFDLQFLVWIVYISWHYLRLTHHSLRFLMQKHSSVSPPILAVWYAWDIAVYHASVPYPLEV